MVISIIGLGLIGGSLGLALRRAGGWEVVGYARRPETAIRALERGAIHRAQAGLGLAVKGVGIVVLATPILATREILREIAPHLSPGAVVTDTASSKARVMEWATEYLPTSVSFVGGHPMAGKEESGIEAAEADLFRGCNYCLAPAPGAAPEAVEAIEGMVRQVGARPLFLEAQEHDYLVAGISHLPILVSAALVSVTTRSPSWPQMARLAATGYRDVTRLASGSVEMDRDICLTNREAVLSWLEKFMQELHRFGGLVSGEGPELEQTLSQVRRARESWLKERG